MCVPTPTNASKTFAAIVCVCVLKIIMDTLEGREREGHVRSTAEEGCGEYICLTLIIALGFVVGPLGPPRSPFFVHSVFPSPTTTPSLILRLHCIGSLPSGLE